jgi:hypothetical protein
MRELLTPLLSPGLLLLVVLPMMGMAAFAAYLYTSRRSMTNDVNKVIADIMANVATEENTQAIHQEPRTVIYAGSGSTVLIRSVLLHGTPPAEYDSPKSAPGINEAT